MTILPGHSRDYGPKKRRTNNAAGNGVESREAGVSPRSDTRRAESMKGFRMLLQPVHLKSDRLPGALLPTSARVTSSLSDT